MKLLCWHGWAMQPSVFDALAAALPEHQVLAPDARIKEGEDLARWAQRLAALIEPDTVLLGWSQGAQLALQALALGARPAALVLIGASPCFVARPEWPAALSPHIVGQFAAAFRSAPQRMLQRFQALQVLGEAQRSMVLAHLATCSDAADAAGLSAALELLLTSDLRHALWQIETPCLLLHGRQDALMPAASAVAMLHALPAASLWLFEDCGHAPHLSHSAELARHLEHFIHDLA